jgi:Ca2+-binding EF-hand superfamily protein
MKTTPVSILLVGILGSHSALAENPPRKERPEAPPSGHNFMEAWKKADQNGDGALSFAEFSSLPRLQSIPEDKRTQLFQRLDKDGDSLITLAEMKRMGPPKHDGPNHRKRLWELDTDKSGGITREEFSAGEMFGKLPPEKQQKLFDRLDTNKDGIISPEDRPERPGPRPGEGRPRNKQPDGKDSPRHPILFPKLDTNNDGFLDFDEFTKIPGISRLGEDEQEKAFDKIDTTKDLKLSPEEMANFRPFERKTEKNPRPVKPRKTPPARTE